jgi:hypothetical protein
LKLPVAVVCAKALVAISEAAAMVKYTNFFITISKMKGFKSQCSK